MTHTPGPWKEHERAFPNGTGKDTTLYVRNSNERHWAICGVFASYGCSNTTMDIKQDEANANARLICAAPDLLAALKMFMDGSNDMLLPKQLEFARAAIAKAEGKS